MWPGKLTQPTSPALMAPDGFQPFNYRTPQSSQPTWLLGKNVPSGFSVWGPDDRQSSQVWKLLSTNNIERESNVLCSRHVSATAAETNAARMANLNCMSVRGAGLLGRAKNECWWLNGFRGLLYLFRRQKGDGVEINSLHSVYRILVICADETRKIHRSVPTRSERRINQQRKPKGSP
jgi:hypothetical protein